MLERYHALGVADDDQHCSPYVYRNFLLLQCLGTVQALARKLDADDTGPKFELEDLERVELQLRGAFQIRGEGDGKAKAKGKTKAKGKEEGDVWGEIEGHPAWPEFVIPERFAETSGRLQQFARLLGEVRALATECDQLESQLKKYTPGDPAVCQYGEVQRLLGRVGELTAVVEFEPTEELARWAGRVAKA